MLEIRLTISTSLKSSVTRPWLMKLFGFTFYHEKGEKGLIVYRKSIAGYKDKIRTITYRSKPYRMSKRLERICPNWIRAGVTISS
jgi:hypothetical protein